MASGGGGGYGYGGYGAYGPGGGAYGPYGPGGGAYGGTVPLPLPVGGACGGGGGYGYGGGGYGPYGPGGGGYGPYGPGGGVPEGSKTRGCGEEPTLERRCVGEISSRGGASDPSDCKRSVNGVKSGDQPDMVEKVWESGGEK